MGMWVGEAQVVARLQRETPVVPGPSPLANTTSIVLAAPGQGAVGSPFLQNMAQSKHANEQWYVRCSLRSAGVQGVCKAGKERRRGCTKPEQGLTHGKLQRGDASSTPPCPTRTMLSWGQHRMVDECLSVGVFLWGVLVWVSTRRERCCAVRTKEVTMQIGIRRSERHGTMSAQTFFNPVLFRCLFLSFCSARRWRWGRVVLKTPVNCPSRRNERAWTNGTLLAFHSIHSFTHACMLYENRAHRTVESNHRWFVRVRRNEPGGTHRLSSARTHDATHTSPPVHKGSNAGQGGHHTLYALR